mmetsp:Transcript_20662/g.61647  ORF Transcript_20662/g.61647 Transcript_20662/m.61647 type:complete len:211 (-) Transcript_20662:3-635(-)
MPGGGTDWNPAPGTKINALRTVVACIEASVIRAWVRDHELPRLLDHPDVWNLVLVEQCRADQKVLVAHEFWAVAEQVRKHAPYERLEACTVFRGDPIPVLRCTIVKEIHGVEVHVLAVPCKRCTPHAIVKVRRCHARKIHAILCQCAREKRVQPTQIPAFDVIIKKGSRDVCAILRSPQRNATPILALDICRVIATRLVVSCESLWPKVL